MVGALALLFLVVPFAELYVLLVVGSTIGVAETIGLLILVSVVGAWRLAGPGRCGSCPAWEPFPWGPCPTGPFPSPATRCAIPLARGVERIGLRPMLLR